MEPGKSARLSVAAKRHTAREDIGRMAVPEANAEIAIGAHAASKLFLDGAVVAFRQLTLDVRRQEILCIVGPSGCGKPTFLRCIAGLIHLSAAAFRLSSKTAARPPPTSPLVSHHSA